MPNIQEIKDRVQRFMDYEKELFTVGPAAAERIIRTQSAIEEHYYGDVSYLLDELEKAQRDTLEARNKAEEAWKEIDELETEHTAMKEVLENELYAMEHGVIAPYSERINAIKQALSQSKVEDGSE